VHQADKRVSAWDAEDSVLQLGSFVNPSEIQFQPGAWLVRAAAIKVLPNTRKPPQRPTPAGTEAPGIPPTLDPDGKGSVPGGGPNGEKKPPGATSVHARWCDLARQGVSGSKLREVVKVAVLPLSAASPEVTVELIIRAEGGIA